VNAARDLPDFHLTRRERDVAKLLLSGMANKNMARVLGVGPDAVKFHMRSILAKTHANNRTQAALRLAGHR
jgi:DNA-binding CsgD family transcriptional regulator